MKNSWLFVMIGAQLIAFTGRGEETNTVELIKQLQKRIEELEQKVKALEAPKAPSDQESERKAKHRIEELDQQVKILERNRELDQEAAEASASGLSGVNSTESPQPQAEVWLGLLKTKPVRSLVTSKYIWVPRR